MKKPLHSQRWFDELHSSVRSALCLERYSGHGLTRKTLRSGCPVIGIAQTGSDLTPCNRYHLELAIHVKEGIRAAGGIPLEFPVHPVQETGYFFTADLARNLQCLSLIEILHGYPLDGVVLMTGCDKTSAALLMGAASVDTPAIALSVGPVLNDSCPGGDMESANLMRAAGGDSTSERPVRETPGSDIVNQFLPIGHCNTMGAALTMNCLIEALGMSLPGSASIPAPYRERQQAARLSGMRIVDMVREDLAPSRILVREAFENAIVVCAAIGGSSSAVADLNAIARHANVSLTMEDWQQAGQHIPQLVNCLPAGEYPTEEFHRAGGVPAVICALNEAGLLHTDAVTVSGKSLADNCRGTEIRDKRVISDVAKPVREKAGLMILSGNLFHSAVMQLSTISRMFHERFLSNPDDPGAFEGIAVVFDGTEDYHNRSNDPSLEIDEHSILVIRGAGPIACAGSLDATTMPPAHLVEKGVTALPVISDGGQSSVFGAPCILHASPEAVVGGNLAVLVTGDRLRVDLNKRKVHLRLPDTEIRNRHNRLQYAAPENQTWWQELYRQHVTGFDEGATFSEMTTFHNIRGKLPWRSD